MASFHSRLLRLARLVYDVPRGPCAIPRDAPAEVREIGLIGSAQAIGRNPTYTGVRDMALVGHLPEGIVIAIRGTQPPRFGGLGDALSIGLDWSNDGLVVGVQSEGLGGIVHQGFLESATSLCRDEGDEGVISRVLAMVGQNAGVTRIILTGHSKGGPVAQIIAFLLRKEAALNGATIDVVTFAAARPGDAEFAALFDATGINCLRYETYYDLVPQLPLGGAPDEALIAILQSFGIQDPDRNLGFVSLGAAVTEIAADANAWRGPRTAFPFNLAQQLSDTPLGDAYRAVAAHMIGPDSHYVHLLETRSVA